MGLTAHPSSPGKEFPLTIEIGQDGTITADYSRVNDISLILLNSIKTEPIGYGALGCALALGRLANSETKLSPSVESKFVGDLMEWVDSYFSIPDSLVMH